MIEMRLLEYFVAVAETGSVSRAAARVLVSQPSLSRQLRGLERSLGVTLFVREGGPLRLSATGHRFLPVARDLLHRHTMAVASTRHASGIAPIALTVAATSTTVLEVIAPFIARAGSTDVVLLALEEVPETAYEAIGTGRADFAMTNEPPPARYASRLLIDFPIFAYVPSSHPWSDRESVDISELSDVPLITSPASGTAKVMRMMDDRRLSRSLAYEAAVPTIAQALAASGHGVAVLSDDPRFGLRGVPITAGRPLTVPMYAAWEPDHYAVDVIETLIVTLRAFCHRHLPAGDDRPSE